MKKACIYDIGNCYVFDCEINNKISLKDLEDFILDIKASAIIFGNPVSLSVPKGNITVFLFHTYSRKAYDLYFRTSGQDMRCLDPFCVQRMLYSIGAYSAREPKIYYFEPIRVIRKEI